VASPTGRISQRQSDGTRNGRRCAVAQAVMPPHSGRD